METFGNISNKLEMYTWSDHPRNGGQTEHYCGYTRSAVIPSVEGWESYGEGYTPSYIRVTPALTIESWGWDKHGEDKEVPAVLMEDGGKFYFIEDLTVRDGEISMQVQAPAEPTEGSCGNPIRPCGITQSYRITVE